MTRIQDYCLGCGMRAWQDPQIRLCDDCIEHSGRDGKDIVDLDSLPDVYDGFWPPLGDTPSVVDTPPESRKKTEPATSPYTYTSGVTTPYSRCDHDGDELLFTIRGREFYAANSFGIDKACNDSKAVIDCAGVSRHTAANFVEGPKKYAVLNSAPEWERIRLNWPDMGAPPKSFTRRQWKKLLELLPIGKVTVCCVGGHGRTGTALAAILIVAGRKTASAAIDFVREKHCPKAIESTSQEIYLENLQTPRQKEQDIEYLKAYDQEDPGVKEIMRRYLLDLKKDADNGTK